MTKRDYLKYNKEVYDKYHNRLYPGDTIVTADSYFNDVHLGVIDHFGERTVIINMCNTKWGKYQQQRYPHRLIKIKDKDGNFMQNIYEGVTQTP